MAHSVKSYTHAREVTRREAKNFYYAFRLLDEPRQNAIYAVYAFSRRADDAVDSVEEKLKITKLAWEIKGARSVKNDLRIKEKFNFQRAAKDVLITSQLRTAMITSKKIKAVNYNIDTYKKKIYVYGIAANEEERAEVMNEAKQILDVEDVITSIFLVEDLRVVKK